MGTGCSGRRATGESAGRELTEVAALSLTIMMAGMFWPFAFGVLAAEILSEFELSPAAFGIAYAVYYLSASTGSPVVGRLVDRWSYRSSVRLMMLGSLVQVGMLAVSTSMLGLVASAVVGGVVMASTNPLTNALISSNLDGRDLRVAVGLKMGGVPLAATASGAILPSIAAAASWRVAVVACAVLPVLVLVVSFRLRGGGHQPEGRVGLRSGRGSGARWTGFEIYALLLGGVTAGINGYLPLYVVDGLSGTLARGGALLAVFALAGALGRFGWSVRVRGAHQAHLAMILLPGLGAIGLMGLALVRDEVWLWGTVILCGLTLMAWQGVAMLAIIDGAPGSVGRASAQVFQWFYAGFVVGAPLAGWLVARADYVAMWLALALTAALASIALIPRAATAWRGRTVGPTT